MTIPIKNNGFSTRDDEAQKTDVSRKDFVGLLGAAACAGGIGLSIAGSLRALVPSVYPDPSQMFRIGKPSEYAPGAVKHFEEENVLIYRTDEGFYAISKICTHLGCIVNQTDGGFQCPCHGSKFNQVGEVVRGPAPRSLAWFHIERLPGGELLVDRGRAVKMGTMFKVEKESA